ncbi:MAG TPA: DUF3015 domain-containing protein [Gammaproteobacteria bacterium]|nr:DUF3015 domain-containing protein [Gammaproteobacteria bacterium]
MKKSTLLMIAAGSLAASITAHAAETGAGCGLGAEIMDGKSGKGANVAAAILNNLVIPNTTFMTTGDGMMGCDPTKTVEREKIKRIFVAANFDELSADTARGGGAHLTTLAHLMGVEDRDLPAFGQLTRTHYEELFGAENATGETVLASLEQVLGSDPELAKYSSR